MNWQDLLGWNTEQIEDLRFIGYSYLRQGHYKTALTFFKALCILDPSSAYDLQTLGALYLQMGDNIKALNTLDKALALEPENGPTLLNRAKALLSLGYRQQGLHQARTLTQDNDPKIRNQAQALLLSY